MHLTHPANTLGAEINLAARATIPRRDVSGNRVTEVRRFACGSNVRRSESQQRSQHRPRRQLSPCCRRPEASRSRLRSPIPSRSTWTGSPPASITDEDGNPLSGWFKIVRGVTGRGLMAVLQPPEGATFGLDKIRIGNRKLTHGGQVAERIQMVLYGKTANLDQPAPPLSPCINHCCRPDSNVDMSKVNLDHVPAERMHECHSEGCVSGADVRRPTRSRESPACRRGTRGGIRRTDARPDTSRRGRMSNEREPLLDGTDIQGNIIPGLNRPERYLVAFSCARDGERLRTGSAASAAAAHDDGRSARAS